MRRYLSAVLMLLAAGARADAQVRPSLPDGLDPATRQAIERLADSLRAMGLPTDPLYEKAEEGKLKQASDAQILTAERLLVKRFTELRSVLGSSIEGGVLSAAATAMAMGVASADIKGLLDAAGRRAGADQGVSAALVTVTDLVSQRVPGPLAVSAVRSLLVRKAPVDQYNTLRLGVGDDIRAGRSPEDAVRLRADALVRALPVSPAPPLPGKPPAE